MVVFRVLVNLGSPFRRKLNLLSAAVLLLVLMLVPLAAEAQQATTTSLVVAPNPAMVGEVVTLTATVTSNGDPVPVGTVTFLSGTQVLATVQVVKASGTATLKTRFAPNFPTGTSFQLNAQYNANNVFQTSQSGPQQLTVTGTEPTITTLTDQPDGNNWDFTASVFGFGFPAATGTASFTDLTTLVNLGNVGLVAPGVSSFQPQQMYRTGLDSSAVAIGDFNGDGFPDLAIANQSDNTVSVLLGNGDGTFQPQATYPVNAFPTGIAVGDFNADGILDMAVSCLNAGGSISVLMGNGDGTFQQQVPYPTDTAQAVAVGDFNNDGLPDLATASQSGTAGALLNNGDGTFTQQQTYGAGQDPFSIAVGDFNRDGNLDLTVVDNTGNGIWVLLGNGDGTFQPPGQFFPVGNGPWGIVVGDFNGDGVPDLAVTNSVDHTVSVLLGSNDQGLFKQRVTYPVGVNPTGIALADLNGDGISDLAVTNHVDGMVGVLLGNGDGTFQPQQTYPVGQGPIAVAAADFNGDGVPDVAGANRGSFTVSILLGGTVTAGQLKNVPVPGAGVHMIQSTYTPDQGFYTGSLSKTVNVNGNGSLIQTTTTVSSSMNPSPLNSPVDFTAMVTGSNGGSPTGTVAFTADGVPIAFCGAVQLVQMQGSSTATCMGVSLALGSHTIQASYSGDGNFAPSAGNLVQMVLNGLATQTALSAAPPMSRYLQLVTFTAMVTDDNMDDHLTGTVTFSTNAGLLCVPVKLKSGCNGDCTVATCSTATLPVGANNTITAAYSGDANYSPSSSMILYRVDGTIPQTTISMSPPQPVTGQVVTLTATVLDEGAPVGVGTVTFFKEIGEVLEELGTVQLVRAGPAPGTATLKIRFAPGNYLLRATFNGVSGFQKSSAELPEFTVTGTEPSITTLTDQPDGNNFDFTATVFGFGFPAATGTASFTDLTSQLNLGNVGLIGPGMSSFQPQQAYPTGNTPFGVASGDFNGDGIADLTVTNHGDGTVSVLLGNADGTFPQQNPTYMVGNSPYGISVGDFNGDGIADLAVTNNADGTVSILLGDGTGKFSPALGSPHTVDPGPRGITVADFNGDGIADLAVANSGDNPGTVSLLLGNGDGTFRPQATFAVGANPEGIAVGDFNGDGIADLAVTNQTDGTVSVLLGIGNGTFQGQVTYGVGNKPEGIAVGDFNGDGIADLAVANICGNDPSCQSPGTVSVLLGDGTGKFSPAPGSPYTVDNLPYDIAVADFKGDGIADLVVTNFCGDDPSCASSGTVSLLLGKGDGTFQPQRIYAVDAGPSGIAVADFNGDGVPDVATANYSSNTASILLGGTVTSGQLKSVPVNGSGVHMIQSAYTPDQGFYTASLSNKVNVNGNGSLISTTTVVTSSVNPSQLNQQVTFTATVAASNGGSPTGTVAFTADNMPIAGCGAVQLVPQQNGSKATCQISTLALGAHNIQVTYGGDQNFSGSAGGLNQVVQGKTTPAVTLTASPNPVNYGSNEYFSATVQSPVGGIPTGTVNFMEGSTLLGTASLMADPSGQFSVATYINNTLVVGSHMVTAAYNGDSNFNSATSNAVPLEVLTAFILTGQPPSNNSGTVSPGGNVTFQVAVSAAWQDHPLIYAVMDCKPPAGTGITCSIICPPSPSKPPGLSNLCVLTQMTGTVATVTVSTSGAAHVILPVHRGERRVVATLMGLGGIGLVGLVLLPFKLRGKAVGGVLFLVILVLCFGTSCGSSFAPGITSPPVDNTFYISVNATLMEEDPTDSTKSKVLGLQTFLYSLLIK